MILDPPKRPAYGVVIAGPEAAPEFDAGVASLLNSFEDGEVAVIDGLEVEVGNSPPLLFVGGIVVPTLLEGGGMVPTLFKGEEVVSTLFKGGKVV